MWGLKDDKDVEVAAGLYFMEFKAGSNPVVLKVMVE